MAKETMIARESDATPINGVSQKTRNIPSSERRTTQKWIDWVNRTDSVERVQDIARTAQAIFNQGGVSFESASAVVEAARQREKEIKKKG